MSSVSKAVALPSFLSPYPEFLSEVLSYLSLEELAKFQVFRTSKVFKAAGKEVYQTILMQAQTQDFLNSCRLFSAHNLHQPTTRRAILDQMPAITALDFRQYCSLRELNFDENSWERLGTILSSPNTSNLTHLTVSLTAPSDYVSDKCVAAIASSCPRLTELNIHWARRVTDAGTAHLIALKQLTSVSFYESQAVSNGTCEMLARMSSLTRVCLDGCQRITHVGIAALLQNAPKLRYLEAGSDIGGHYAIREQASIARAIAEHGHQLEHLNMSGACYANTELLQIAARCRSLVQIDIGRYHREMLTNPAELGEQMRKINRNLKVLGLEPRR